MSPDPQRLKREREPCRSYVWEHSFPLLSIRPDRLLIGTSATGQSSKQVQRDTAVSRYNVVADKQISAEMNYA